MPLFKFKKPRGPSLPKAALLAISLCPVLAGCSSNFVTDAKQVAEGIGEITPSRHDTCETKRQVAAQSSRIRTISEGREVVVAAPKCEPVKS